MDGQTDAIPVSPILLPLVAVGDKNVNGHRCIK